MMMMVPMLKIMMVLANSRTPTQWSWPVSKMVVVDDEDGGVDVEDHDGVGQQQDSHTLVSHMVMMWVADNRTHTTCCGQE